MNLIVTCGPAQEPIDGMRLLTNRSTGALGQFLARFFQERGHQVWCLRGEGATVRDLPSSVQTVEFGTNDDLAHALARLAFAEPIDAVFHAAALCDFGVAEVRDGEGRPVTAGKFSSRAEGYTLALKPLPKVILQLRPLFPHAFLTGWKYEVEGDAKRVAALGARQIEEADTDLCILNGPGYGPGFGMLNRKGEQEKILDRNRLAKALLTQALLKRVQT